VKRGEEFKEGLQKVKVFIMEFYKARLSEGMAMNDIDKIDFSYYMKLLRLDEEKKTVEQNDKFKHVYIDELNIF